MKDFKYRLKCLLPKYWFFNYPYSENWDKRLNNLMEIFEFKEINGYTVKLGDTEIWIENYPYASFHPYSFGGKIFKVRPSRITIMKAYEKLVKDLTFK